MIAAPDVPAAAGPHKQPVTGEQGVELQRRQAPDAFGRLTDVEIVDVLIDNSPGMHHCVAGHQRRLVQPLHQEGRVIAAMAWRRDRGDTDCLNGQNLVRREDHVGNRPAVAVVPGVYPRYTRGSEAEGVFSLAQQLRRRLAAVQLATRALPDLVGAAGMVGMGMCQENMRQPVDCKTVVAQGRKDSVHVQPGARVEQDQIAPRVKQPAIAVEVTGQGASLNSGGDEIDIRRNAHAGSSTLGYGRPQWSMTRARKAMQASIWTIVIHSSGVCACWMSPGPQTTTGCPAS